MKKILAMVLALCLLCSAAAFAATTITNESGSQTASTTVTYTIEAPVYEYIVTIPSAITLNSEGKGSFDIEVDMTNYQGSLGEYGDVSVRLTGSANYDSEAGCFRMKDTQSNNYIDYQITSNGYSCYLNDLIMTAFVSNVVKTTTMNVEVTDDYGLSGVFTDTLTFTVSSHYDDGGLPLE